MSIIQELRQRKVFRVAAVYCVLTWGILQVVDVIVEPLSLPDWFASLTIVLLAIGFPVALIFSWIFDLGPQGPTRTTTSVNPGADIGFRSGLEVALLLVLILGISWLILRDFRSSAEDLSAPTGTPIVVLMDTYAARGVYDEETRIRSRTNADVLSEILEDFAVITQKEAIGSTWGREVQILKQNPSLVLIHRSAFFHSMAQELGVTYPQGSESPSEEFLRLYEIADNKLVALLGLLANGDSEIKFLVYSRGTGGEWKNPQFRAGWIHDAQGRFPTLENRVTAIVVPGGLSGGSLMQPEAVALFKSKVHELLALPGEPAN